MKRLALAPAILLLLATASSTSAQEADVRAAIDRTLTAWAQGEYELFASFYHPEARGFFLDGGPRIGGFQVAMLEAAHEAGFRADVALDDVDVRVLGETAIAVGYLAGTLTLPGGAELPGTWRYSETRVLTDGRWLVIQFHVSPRQEPGA